MKIQVFLFLFFLKLQITSSWLYNNMWCWIGGRNSGSLSSWLTGTTLVGYIIVWDIGKMNWERREMLTSAGTLLLTEETGWLTAEYKDNPHWVVSALSWATSSDSKNAPYLLNWVGISAARLPPKKLPQTLEKPWKQDFISCHSQISSECE